MISNANWLDPCRLGQVDLLLELQDSSESGILRPAQPLCVNINNASIAPGNAHLPLGRNPLTLTTTLTFPPGPSILPTLPSLDRNDGVEADDLTGRISAATPGISRGSRAMPIRVSFISRMASQNLCCKLRYMNIESCACVDFSRLG